ncbi:MAG: FG-GAP repeat domain-containing protein [Armatimonadota bacterium]
MNRFIPGGLIAALAAAGATSAALLQGKGALEPVIEPASHQFRKVVVNEKSDFEAACAADIDGDGRLDIVSGDTWYQAPGWAPHRFREISVWGRGPGSSGYRGSFAELPYDVNGDHRTDIVSSDYATGEIFWHENPGPSGEGLWTRHSIAKPGSAETSVVAPIAGRGTRDILPNVAGKVVWYELRDPGPRHRWIEHAVGSQGAGHGIGHGDVDGDGRTDLITPTGWWRNIDAPNDRWEWRPEVACKPGDLGISTPVHDFDGDGDNDIVFGSGHQYGLYWLRNLGDGKWEQLPIDTTASQFHALSLIRFDRRGEPMVLTGKRYLAHDHDPGAEEPLALLAYRYDRKAKAWRKQVLDTGTTVGTGLLLGTADLRRTGRIDVIAPGKSGLYLFENLGRAPKTAR